MNVIATLGSSALLTALAASVFAIAAALLGHLGDRPRAVVAAGRAITAVGGLLTAAVLLLAYALLTNDFSISHVAQVSSRGMQPWMKWASIYSGQPGSLLYWTWMLSLFLGIFSLTTLRRIPWGRPHAIVTMGAILLAFLVALVFFASPFRTSPVTPADGLGLNPLLVDSGMLIHPPALLAGLVSTSVPFTLGVTALAAGRLDAAWVGHARSWALLSFLVLGTGNLLGAWWAYTVLGWGGYWGWDPVENSAILPLLPITAFLHSLMVQERRGMLKGWNLALVLAAFALAVFGTFNVRSGLVASVHSFAQSEVGAYFLVLVGIVVLASVVLLAWRWPRLGADHDFDSFASRETALIINSYVLVAIALVVLGGTLFPVFSELATGARITVGPPFFNDTTGPLWVALLLALVGGTVLPWRRVAGGLLARRLRWPLAAGAALAAVLAVLGMGDPFALATVVMAALVLVVTVREYATGTRARRRAGDGSWPAALAGLVRRNRRRSGGYLVHIGIALVAIAAVSSYSFQEQVRMVVAPGESFEVGGHTIAYDGLFSRHPGVNGIESEVVARITVDGTHQLNPGQRFFTNFQGQPVAIVAIDGSPLRDVYVFVQNWTTEGVAEVQVFVNPLMQLLWLGGVVMMVGGLLAYTALPLGAGDGDGRTSGRGAVARVRRA